MSHHHRTYTTKNHKERKKQTDGRTAENSQLETFIEHRRPVVTLRLGCKLAFLIAQVWSDDVDFHKRPKHAICHPLDVVDSNH